MRITLLVSATTMALIASPVLADKPDEKPAETEASETAEASEKSEKAGKKDERICRYIRADASSRRKTKVCLTAKQWREANQGR